MSFQQISDLLRAWPNVTIPEQPYADSAFERIRLVLKSLRTGASMPGSADLATLIRHVVRRESVRFSYHAQLRVPCDRPWPTKDTWRAHGCFVLDSPNVSYFTIEAEEWRPEWAATGESGPPFAAVEKEEQRRRLTSVPADPAVRERFRLTSYLSPAQADAVRGVALSPPGSVTYVDLPTGGGKSLVGLSAALLGKGQGVSIVVVPTIALAYDQVQQTRAQCPDIQVDAWRSELTPVERQAIRQKIRNGQQRVLYAAPESITGALAGALYSAARNGLLRAFIVDEAHLVAQWGNGFRPEFQAMSGLWHQLRDSCPSGGAFRTVLMTATLTEESFSTLRTFFRSDDGFEVLASVHLRPEPDYFVVQCNGRITQEERVLEALRHGPRPAILYVTKRSEAIDWHRRLLKHNWNRVGCVHGGTTGVARERAIDMWRENHIDVMVATSAFGLGMDKGDVRLVIHACVPETVDRFYQEVGRGGRDGRASVSMLIWTIEDRETAAGISAPAIITEELGLERWNSIRHQSVWDDETLLANLRALRPGMEWDSEANMGWNMKTILLLARAGALELKSRPPPDVTRLDGESEFAFSERQQAEMERHWSICPVRVTNPNTTEPSFWQNAVAKSRDETLSAADENWRRMREVLGGRTELSRIFRDVYRVRSAGIEVGSTVQGLPVLPPRRLCASLATSLETIHKQGGDTVVVAYPTWNERAGGWQRSLFEAVTRLVQLGIREVAVPPGWRDAPFPTGRGRGENPLQTLHRGAPEGFVIVRSLADEDPLGTAGWPLPRVSIVDWAESPRRVPQHLLLLERPLHIILAPADSLDPRHTGRRMGDVTPPHVMRLDMLLNLLQL